MTEEKKNLVGPFGRAIVVFVAVMTIFSVGAITGVMIADENPKCPDCNLICPDVIDYGEDYEGLLVAISESLNRSEGMNSVIYNELKNNPTFDNQAILDAIRNSELNISEKMALYTSWLFSNSNYSNHKLDLIEMSIRELHKFNKSFPLPAPQGDYESPRDDILFWWVEENLTFWFIYFNNADSMYYLSPTFEVQNWTVMIQWVIAEQSGQWQTVFSQYQKNYILLIATNMAYYKETGTWLGE